MGKMRVPMIFPSANEVMSSPFVTPERGNVRFCVAKGARKRTLLRRPGDVASAPRVHDGERTSKGGSLRH